jgi:hypothetical protein
MVRGPPSSSPIVPADTPEKMTRISSINSHRKRLGEHLYNTELDLSVSTLSQRKEVKHSVLALPFQSESRLEGLPTTV